MDLRPPATILSFKASLITNNRDDKLRSFIVNYYMDDDAFSVFEQVVPNSGFPGGKLIGKAKFVNPETGKPFTPDEITIDAEIVLNGFKFHLDEATEGALRQMEAKSDMFTRSDLAHIFESTFPILKEKKALIEREFRAKDKAGRGRVAYSVTNNIFNDYDLFMNKQERLTVLRRFQFADAELFVYEDFLKMIQ